MIWRTIIPAQICRRAFDAKRTCAITITLLKSLRDEGFCFIVQAIYKSHQALAKE